MSFVLYALLAYILFQFIFRFVVPLFIATRTIKKGFREMKSRMEEHQEQEQGGFNQAYRQAGPQPAKPSPAQREKTGEYIDFEEVK